MNLECVRDGDKEGNMTKCVLQHCFQSYKGHSLHYDVIGKEILPGEEIQFLLYLQ